MGSHKGTKASRDEELERLATAVVDSSYVLHTNLGPGLLESAYEVLLHEELRSRGIEAARQVSIPLRYKSVIIDNAFKIDLLIENRLIVELKSVERLMPVHGKQVLTYLRLMKLPLGLRVNFGDTVLRTGIKRIANDYTGDRD